MKKLLPFILLSFCLYLPVNGEAGLLGVNLLVNPGFEDGLNDWTTDYATLRSGDPAPHSGNSYLMGAAGGPATSYTYQIIDLQAHGFTEQELSTGSFTLGYGGWQSGWHTQQDSGRIEIVLRDSAQSVLASDDLGWFYSNHTWTLLEDELPLEATTRYIEYAFRAQRYEGTNLDAYMDDAFLSVSSSAVPAPDALWLLGSGLFGLLGLKRKSRK